jgi:hypothetical protein
MTTEADLLTLVETAWHRMQTDPELRAAVTTAIRLVAAADPFWQEARGEALQEITAKVAAITTTIYDATLTAEVERHRNTNLVRAVLGNYRTAVEEWINETIHSRDFNRVPWLIAEKAQEEVKRLTESSAGPLVSVPLNDLGALLAAAERVLTYNPIFDVIGRLREAYAAAGMEALRREERGGTKE